MTTYFSRSRCVWMTIGLFYIIHSQGITAADEFFLVKYPGYNPGFFSGFNTLIGILDVYDTTNPAGIRVEFDDPKIWYYDHSVGDNVWDYYFEPIDIGSSKKSTIRTFSWNECIAFALYSQLRMPRTRAHELIQKYIHIKQHILQKITDFYREFCAGYYMIGVHYRGTDKGSEVPLMPYDYVLKEIKKTMTNSPVDKKYTRIFLATDDAHFYRFLKDQLSDQMVATDSLRSSNSIGTHTLSYGNRYKKGEDAIIDCILLSRCDILLKTGSNLSDCSVQFNPQLPVIHLSATSGDEHAPRLPIARVSTTSENKEVRKRYALARSSKRYTSCCALI